MGKIALCVSALALLAQAGPTVGQTPPALIPRTVLFGGAQRYNPSQSGDGKWLAWQAPLNGVMNVWVAPLDNPTQARPVAPAFKTPIRVYGWARDSKTIFFMADENGNENFDLYGVDIVSGAVRNLTPYKNVAVSVVGTSYTLRDRALILLNKRTPYWPDVYEVNYRTGELKLVMQNDSFISFIADDALRLRLAIKVRADGGRDYLKITDGVVEQTPFVSVGYDDVSGTHPIGFERTGATLYWLDTRGRDKAALVAQDFATGKISVIAEDARGDIDTPAWMMVPKTGRIDAYTVNDLRPRWAGLSPKVKADMAFLQAHLGGPFIVTPRSYRDDRWILLEDPVSGPQTVWRYDRKTRRLTRLFSMNPDLEGAPLVDMHPVEIRSRDGLRLVSYLTLPQGSARKGELRPDHPLPLVLDVHGGPAARDTYKFDPIHQWLANRGYAVLSVNFRSSSGLGKQFLKAGDFEWGAKMQDDLIDAVDWAVNAGIADRRKVAIVGGSYGGFAVLAGLAFTPHHFACGVDMSGPSDLASLMQTLPASWAPRWAELVRKMGDPSTPEGAERMKSRSPLSRADSVTAPLLVVQGANDVRVNRAQSDKMVAALQSRNIPVTYLVFGEEGHNFERPQNNLAFLAVEEQFLARCLGGRSEPIEDSLQASTVEVETGAAYVPGLVEALQARAALAKGAPAAKPTD